jgi:hypothetical protein
MVGSHLVDIVLDQPKNSTHGYAQYDGNQNG